MLSYAFSLRPLCDRVLSALTHIYEAHVDQDRRGTGARVVRAAAHPASVLQRDRGGDRNGRHLARRPYCRHLPGASQDRPKNSRRVDAPGGTGQDAGGQHRQAAQHQRLDSAAPGRDCGTSGEGLQHSRLSGCPLHGGGACGAGPVCRGPGLGRESRVARRQFRPARSRGRESVRAEASTEDEALAASPAR